MQWFPFQAIMFHTEDNIRSPAETFQLLLKVFSMFKNGIWYDKRIVNGDVPDAVGRMSINCEKIFVVC